MNNSNSAPYGQFITGPITVPVDVLAVIDEALGYGLGTKARREKMTQARAAIAGLMAFNRSLVLDGRQRFNATPEQIALSDAAEAALRACGGA